MKPLLVSLLASIANICLAQSTTGGLEGTVLSLEGKPVEGVSILLSGPNLLGTIGTTTNSKGHFKILSLALGRCSAKISHISFTTQVVEDIEIKLGVTTNLGTIMLQTSQTQLEEVVIDSAPATIPYGAEIQHTLSRGEMNSLPVNRDYKNAITMLPQVNTSYFGDGLNIAGATGGDNMYYVDGINVTDIYNSQFVPAFNNSSNIPYNFIKAVNVKQGGYNAEFGRTLGGIVDVVTESGSNEFRGQVFGYYSGSTFNGSPRGGATGSRIRRLSNYDGGASIGGAVTKDKLWFFIAYSRRENLRETEIKGHGFFDDKTIANILAAKFDWKASLKTNIEVVLLADPTTSTPVLQVTANSLLIPNTIVNPQALLAEVKSGGVNGIVNGRTQLSDKLLWEYSASAYNRSSVFKGASQFGNSTSQYFDHLTSTLDGGIGWNEDFNLYKYSFKSSLTRFGKLHTSKGGIELERNSQKGTNSYPEPAIDRHKVDSFTNWSFYQNAKVRINYVAAFYQYELSLSRNLMVEAGLRWEQQQLMDQSTILQSFDDQWQPRLGINWFLNPRQSRKVSVYAGRVYQALPANFSLAFSPSFEVLIESYSTDPRSPGSVPTSTVFSLEPYEYKLTEYNVKGVKSTYADQFVVRYQQSVGKTMSFVAGFTAKTLRDAYILVSDNDFLTYLGNPGKGKLTFLPNAKHNYTAFELGLAGNNASKRLLFGVNYVWSKNFGNYLGFSDQEARNYSPPGPLTFRVPSSPERVANMTGLLPNDRTHVLKVNATYKFGFGLTTGAYISAMSGTPLSKFIPGEIFLLPELFEKRGTAGRLPMIWDTNLRMTYNHLKSPFRFSIDIFNMLGLQAVVDVEQFAFTDPAETPNPSYKKPVRYQAPTAVRLGVEYNF